jgi:hypothetical protein
MSKPCRYCGKEVLPGQEAGFSSKLAWHKACRPTIFSKRQVPRDDLRAILNALRQNGKIRLSGGEWRLV